MSHSSGAVRFSDGTVKFYEYNGTADVPISHLYDTMQEMADNWRKGEWLNCTCEAGMETVEIYTTYGLGFSWQGEGCKGCRAVLGMPFEDPHYDTRKDGEPPWWKDIPKGLLKIERES